MSETDDGGPAFPIMDSGGGGYCGMTLRDYFAGQALAGGDASPGCEWKHERWASYAYRVADAMLKARDQEPK